MSFKKLLCGVLLAQIPFDVPERVEELQKIVLVLIQAQEESLGIKYNSLPTVRVYPSVLIGFYESTSDTIFVDGLFLQQLTEMSKSEPEVVKNLEDNILTPVLHHELAHFYMDKVHEKTGKGSWPPASFSMTTSTAEIISTRIIAEGIAKYFEIKMTSGSVKFDDLYYPSTIDGFFLEDEAPPRSVFNKYLLYEGGCHLVKPVLDKDCVNGVLYLIEHLPTEEELLNLPAYRKKVLKALEDNSKNK